MLGELVISPLIQSQADLCALDAVAREDGEELALYETELEHLRRARLVLVGPSGYWLSERGNAVLIMARGLGA